MLVNVEQGSTNPSIVTLLRISEALGVGLPSLVDVARAPVLQVTRAGHAPALWRGSAGGQATLVAGSESPHVVELWHWDLAVGERHTSDPHTAGTRELLLVLDGEVDLTVGRHVERLGAGDSASFRGDLPHSYGHAGGSPARFALTVFQPNVGHGEGR